MSTPPLTALCLTPRQAFEVARLLDRTGDGIVTGHDGVVTLLVDIYGTGSPNLALELDADGDVIARQVLSLHRRDDDDEFSDLGDEQPLPYPVDLSHARPAPRCRCVRPVHDEGLCLVCGHSLPESAVQAA